MKSDTSLLWRLAIPLVFAAHLSVVSTVSPAADIRPDGERWKSIRAVLEGDIVDGDAKKVETFLIDGDGAQEILLASPGGNLLEAMKIGRLIRKLNITTLTPSKSGEKYAGRQHVINDLGRNYRCASSCFFIFIAGISRRADWLFGDTLLGIHRPFLPEATLRKTDSQQAIDASKAVRIEVDQYSKEMGISSKYIEEMFSISKDKIRWITEAEFEKDFEGIALELRDWVDAQCDHRTESEKRVWDQLKNKRKSDMTGAEIIMSDAILNKNQEQSKCETKLLEKLYWQAFQKYAK